MTGHDIDLGHGHRLRFVAWRPDRALDPTRAHLPDVDRYGAIIEHPLPDGARCAGGFLIFDGPVQRELDRGRPRWQVASWDPLTLTPSVLCHCGDHGFITDGRWVPA